MDTARPSSEQKAYEAIRHGILAGGWPGGQHLRAADLARQPGISRTPVREALRRLFAEGLVEVFEVRAVLESRAATLATTRLKEVDIAGLAAMPDRMEAAAATGRELPGSPAPTRRSTRRPSPLPPTASTSTSRAACWARCCGRAGRTGSATPLSIR